MHRKRVKGSVLDIKMLSDMSMVIFQQMAPMPIARKEVKNG